MLVYIAISQSVFCPEYSKHDVLTSVPESWKRTIDDGLYVGSCVWILLKPLTVLIIKVYFRGLEFMELLVATSFQWLHIFLEGHKEFNLIYHSVLSDSTVAMVYHRVHFGPFTFLIIC